MQRVIKLKDNNVEMLFCLEDFEYLIEKYMGYEAVQYFRDANEEIKDSYNEQVETLIEEDINDITVDLDSLVVNINALCANLKKLKRGVR